MKRSRSVRLVLMGIVAGGLAGCDSDPPQEAFVFQNPSQCIADKRGSDAECVTAFQQAQREHVEKAPRYEAKADCERDFGDGRCEERRVSSSQTPGSTPRSTSSFAPLMMGYLMGRAGQAAPAQPLYQFRGTNDYRTPGGATIPGVAGGRPTGARTVPASALASTPRPVTVPRGGFGSTAMAVARSSGA